MRFNREKSTHILRAVSTSCCAVAVGAAMAGAAWAGSKDALENGTLFHPCLLYTSRCV